MLRHITSNPLTQTAPSIFENYIVWCDTRFLSAGRTIVLGDLNKHQVQAISVSHGPATNPGIAHGKVVWQGASIQNRGIYVYDITLQQITCIAQNQHYPVNPDISQNHIVWSDKHQWQRSLYMYNIDTAQLSSIKTTGRISGHPRVDGDHIVWIEKEFGEAPQVHVYDIKNATNRIVSSAKAYPFKMVAISGDNIVWQDYRLRTPQVYIYNLISGDEHLLSNVPARQINPSISGNFIVWQDYRNSDGGDIYLYDINASEEHLLNVHKSCPKYPDVNEGRVVWIDTYNGNDAVYLENKYALPDNPDEPQPGKDFENIYKFLAGNLTQKTGMPLSYRLDPPGFWKNIGHPNTVDAIIERLLVANSVNIYDAACGQIAATILGKTGFADQFTSRLLSGQSGVLQTIRANSGAFTYNGTTVGIAPNQLHPDNTWFFRMIADVWEQTDPLDGKITFPGFPSGDRLHHEDWKPIAGENAWGAIIGPLQVAYKKYNGNIPIDAAEVRLALSILPAIQCMQSPTGGIYYAPDGTAQATPGDISNENNASMYAALRMLREVLDPHHNHGQVADHINTITTLMTGIEHHFRHHTYNQPAGVFDQGGILTNGQFQRTQVLAVDVQTWGLSVFGPALIDQWFGKDTAYHIWENTKTRGGFYDRDGILLGVGYSSQQNTQEKVLSGEWTFGALLMVKILAEYYEHRKQHDKAETLRTDAITMREGVECHLRVTLENNWLAYLYANRRYRIPFGWWANPFPSLTSTAWAVMVDTGFNPFILGGGTAYEPL